MIPWASRHLRVLPAGLLAVALLAPGRSAATTLTVTNLGDSGAPGQLRTLVNTSASGDSIIIPAGTITLTARLDIGRNLTIQGAGAAATIINGGGIDVVFRILSQGFSSAVMVTIREVTVAGGKAGEQSAAGGILILRDATLNLTNSTVSTNSGIGIVNSAGTLTITNSVVSGNTASGGSGGGITNFGRLTVTNTTIANNGGSGIDNQGGPLWTITNSTIANNAGSGISNSGGGPQTISNSTISGNTASGGSGGSGGGILNCGGDITVTNVTISGNTAANDGGGIAIPCTTGTLTLTNVTVTGNTANSGHNGTGKGGGVAAGRVGLEIAPIINVKNTIIAGNTDNGGGGPDCFGALISQGFNLRQDFTGCLIIGVATGHITGANPRLGPLAIDGGPTQTHALLPGSPAIDAGSPDCPPPATDQRGVSRPQGTHCDIGAYEAAEAEIEAPAVAFITRLYQQVLSREPDAAGLQGWIQQIQQDGSLVPTVLAFFHSAEFLSRNTTNEQFLTLLYHTFLSRDPDPAGLGAFLTALQSGQLTRDNLLDIFLDSQEFAAQNFLTPLDPLPVFVTTLYVRILGRGPDQAGLHGFVTQLQQTRTVLPTVQQFLASPEFLARNTNNTEFVTLLYRVFLGRVPDAAGLASFVALLNSGGATRDQLVAQFAASGEFQATQAALFPFPDMAAGNWGFSGSITLTGCSQPQLNGTTDTLGFIKWTQSDTNIQGGGGIVVGGAVFSVELSGTISANGHFGGTLEGVNNEFRISFSGSFTGVAAGNDFALQFSGRVTGSVTCTSLGGSISAGR